MDDENWIQLYCLFKNIYVIVNLRISINRIQCVQCYKQAGDWNGQSSGFPHKIHIRVQWNLQLTYYTFDIAQINDTKLNSQSVLSRIRWIHLEHKITRFNSMKIQLICAISKKKNGIFNSICCSHMYIYSFIRQAYSYLWYIIIMIFIWKNSIPIEDIECGNAMKNFIQYVQYFCFWTCIATVKLSLINIIIRW